MIHSEHYIQLLFTSEVPKIRQKKVLQAITDECRSQVAHNSTTHHHLGKLIHECVLRQVWEKLIEWFHGTRKVLTTAARGEQRVTATFKSDSSLLRNTGCCKASGVTSALTWKTTSSDITLAAVPELLLFREQAVSSMNIFNHLLKKFSRTFTEAIIRVGKLSAMYFRDDQMDTILIPQAIWGVME